MQRNGSRFCDKKPWRFQLYETFWADKDKAHSEGGAKETLLKKSGDSTQQISAPEGAGAGKRTEDLGCSSKEGIRVPKTGKTRVQTICKRVLTEVGT